MKPLNIGNVSIKNPYILAPMAGVTDLPFRLICKEFGAGLTCMEMVSAKAIIFKNKKSLAMLNTGEGESPVSLQLFGNEPELLSEVISSIEDYPFDIIDINMGCPVPKVVKNGEGSALLRNPVLAGQIIKACAEATNKPLTVKIRTGFDENSKNCAEIARIAEANGAAAITVHGRTREQYYEGRADWKEIAKVKASVKIPVIGNGDIFTANDAKAMYEETGVDGFAIGRGARGNPWIFKELIAFEERGEILPPPDVEEISRVILRHCKDLIREKGEYIGIREMRKHAAWYLSGIRGAAKIRGRLGTIQSIEELSDLLSLLT